MRSIVLVSALLLAACAKETPDGTPEPGTSGLTDAGPVTDAVPRAAEYPGGPYGILQSQTVGPVTFKKKDDTTLSLTEIRAMPAVGVILVIEAGLGQDMVVRRLDPLHDELAGKGVFLLAVLAESNSTAQTLADWEAKTQWKGTSVYGGRISGGGGITAGFPTVYIVHAGNMQIATRISGGLLVTADAVRAAALDALATAPP